MSIPADFNHSAKSRELAQLCLGDLLGEGAFRRVHVWQPDHKMVIKLEYGNRTFCNVHEWQLWFKAKGTWLQKWLAPCVHISPCGEILVQERTTEPTERQLVKRVPSFFKDVKWENWGMLNGRLVCHDYGFIEARSSPLPKQRLVKAPWA